MATCKNGHYYPDDKAACPYCPQNGPATNPPENPSALLRTLPGVPAAFEALATPPPVSPPAPAAEEPGAVAGPAALKTQIGTTPAPATAPKNATDRKLMGWLVSFDHDPLGRDYRLREGRNTVGTAPDCEVTISGDPNISGRHLTILFRLGEVLFRDELSTNGTFINDNLQNEGALRDGDVIRVGSTHLLFRSAQIQ